MNTIQKKYEEYFDEIDLHKYKKIAIYGTGHDGKILKKFLEERNITDFYLVDKDDICEKMLDGQYIYTLNEVADKIDCILVGSSKYHLAIGLRIEKECQCRNIEILNPFKMRKYCSENELIINKYQENVEAESEDVIIDDLKKRTDYFDAVRAYVNEAIKYKPLFGLVEIETYNRCNGVCEFCPVNRKADPREEHYMSEDLFYKIVNELMSIKYDGRISLFSNNEPLLDERIFVFSKYLREKLPNAKIHMFTNGTLFTLEKFKNLIVEIDELVIDNYTQNLRLIKPVEEIKNYCILHPELKKKVTIVLRKPKELLLSRGGEAPNRKKLESYTGVTCSMPFQQMIIRPTGEISLCCNDPLGRMTLGDLRKQTLLEAWYGEKYENIRNEIISGRENIEHCRYCDYFSLYI